MRPELALQGKMQLQALQASKQTLYRHLMMKEEGRDRL